MRIAGERASGLYYFNLYEEIVFMSELHLNSLEITNFRCFEHLTIEKLGRVNLIVGKNSVGKTALLEALWLLNSDACWPVIHKILYDRNELVRYRLDAMASLTPMEQQEQMGALKSFFTGRPPKPYNQTKEPDPKFLYQDALACSFVTSTERFYLALRTVQNILMCSDSRNTSIPLINGFSFQPHHCPALPQKEALDYSVIEESKKFKTVFIPLAGLSWKATCTYWDDIVLTNKENEIISCLQLLDREISRFTFKGENMQDRVRYSVVKTGRFPDPLPLANMGEGIQRIFALALAMSTASNGYLIIDEFETGLHHSIQADVWRAVFKLAHEWNVQVFATTHSWDCVEAFQEAAAEDQNEEAMLIRLQRKRDGTGIVATPYDEESLKIVTRQGIEVR